MFEQTIMCGLYFTYAIYSCLSYNFYNTMLFSITVKYSIQLSFPFRSPRNGIIQLSSISNILKSCQLNCFMTHRNTSGVFVVCLTYDLILQFLIGSHP